MKKIALALFLTLASAGAANAANSAAGTVGALTFSDGGNLFFTTSATRLNPANCAATSYVIAGTNPQFKNYYAMMLTAQASGSDVVVRIDDNVCLTLGSTTYPQVRLVQNLGS